MQCNTPVIQRSFIAIPHKWFDHWIRVLQTSLASNLVSFKGKWDYHHAQMPLCLNFDKFVTHIFKKAGTLKTLAYPACIPKCIHFIKWVFKHKPWNCQNEPSRAHWIQYCLSSLSFWVRFRTLVQHRFSGDMLAGQVTREDISLRAQKPLVHYTMHAFHVSYV